MFTRSTICVPSFAEKSSHLRCLCQRTLRMLACIGLGSETTCPMGGKRERNTSQCTQVLMTSAGRPGGRSAKDGRRPHLLGWVAAHEHDGLVATAGPERPEEHGGALPPVGGGEHPQPERPHAALRGGAPGAAQPLRVVGSAGSSGSAPARVDTSKLTSTSACAAENGCPRSGTPN